MSAEVAAQQATYYIQNYALEYGYVARRPKSDGLRYVNNMFVYINVRGTIA